MSFFRFAANGALILSACALVNPCSAKVMLAPPFTDHAVLQRDVPVPVWGQAVPGEKITVVFRRQKLKTAADARGRWHVTLAPMSGTAEGADLVVKGTSKITLHDVVVGEVWLASGQSNMEWPLSLARDGKAEVAVVNSPLVRHLRIEHSPSDLPAEKVKTSGWQTAMPGTAGGFSAVGYFFARALAEKLGVPVGIIHSSWGGTPIESWLAKSVLEKTSAWPHFHAEWQEALKVFPQKLAEYPALDTAWRKADEEQRATGKPNILPWPHPPIGPGTAYAPGGLFNGMIMPLVPYALRGVLWYQGESNVGHAREYAEEFPAMIRSWRAAWSQGDLPFYFVQLPNYADGDAKGRKWAELREAQEAALKLPATGMAVTLDVGEEDVLHPTNKRPVGERLALIAAAQIHGQHGEWSGPVVESIHTEGAAIRVKFTRADGLVFHVNPPTGFEIAGADRIFHPANAVLAGDFVVVSSPDVPTPVAVRYAWTNSPVVSLYNRAGLPAGPFRTDDW